MFNLDFDKACIGLVGVFLDTVMMRKDLLIDGRRWIVSCFSSVSFLVLANGKPSPSFGVERIQWWNPFS